MDRVIRDLSLTVVVLMIVMLLNAVLACSPIADLVGAKYLADQTTPRQETISVLEVNQGDETTIIVACGRQIIRHPHRCHKH